MLSSSTEAAHSGVNVCSPGRFNSKRQETLQNHEVNAKKQMWKTQFPRVPGHHGVSWGQAALCVCKSEEKIFHADLFPKMSCHPLPGPEKALRRPWRLKVWPLRTCKHEKEKPLLVHTSWSSACRALWRLSCVLHTRPVLSIPDTHPSHHAPL